MQTDGRFHVPLVPSCLKNHDPIAIVSTGKLTGERTSDMNRIGVGKALFFTQIE